jgi:L,D-peptidoglycan transpeptidase YkuD (ErfK/YbiS/YcfS/YnhG family)
MKVVVWPPGHLQWHGNRVDCALGRSGIRVEKREGDGATPAGLFPLRRVMYRADRLPEPETGLPVRPLRRDDGWCDDPEDAAYNRLIRTPFTARHESLWRDDALYDVVVELGFNDDVIEPGRGSAIFLHCAKPGYAPTEGCVALALADLLALLRDCDRETTLSVGVVAPSGSG